MIDIKTFRKENKITQKEICDILGIAQPYLSAIESGSRPLNEEKFRMLYKQYGDILLKYKTADIVIELGDKGGGSTRTRIPFYDDVASIGGINEKVANLNGVSAPCEYIDAGDWFKDATAAIRHYGESMVEYPSGCILALKEVVDRRLIVPGRDYVIETSEYRITKQAQLIKEGFLTAYSSNTDTYADGNLIHPPFDIPLDAIVRMFLVLGYVVKKNGNTTIYRKK